MHQKLSRKNVSIIILLLIGIYSGAQESDEYTRYKALYPDARSVRLLQDTAVEIAIKDNEINIVQTFVEEDMYLNESATYESKRSLWFSTFFELQEIEALAINYENGRYRETKVKNFTEKDDLDQHFYGDTKSLSFIYPNLKKGSKSKLSYSEKVNNPRFLSAFYFADITPIVRNRVIIKAHKDIQLRFLEFNTEGYNITFKKEESRNLILYTWELQNSVELDIETNISSYKKVMPHIIPIITSYNVKGETMQLLQDVNDLYGWYYSLVKDINKEEADPELVALVQELTKDKDSNLDKVKAIYYWTQQHIKYIAFEYALGGFIPREANDVFQKKYGDCKDNSSILLKMLELAGLKGSLTWIGTRSIPYSYNDVPSPLVDNHMILSYTEDDTTYFLDATGRYGSMDLPSSFIQGKEALISNGPNDFVIKNVPVVPAEKNAYIEHCVVTISGGTLSGKASTAISGYKKIEVFNALEQFSDKEKLKGFYNGILQKGSNRFLVNEITETNRFNYDEDFLLDYDFTIENYVKNLGDEIYINLNLNKDLLYFKTKPDRKHEIDYDYKEFSEFRTELKIPEGYTIDYIPEPVSFKNDLIETGISYTVNDTSITYTHITKLNFITLDLEQQKIVNSVIEKMEKAFKEIIVLTKK